MPVLKFTNAAVKRSLTVAALMGGVTMGARA